MQNPELTVPGPLQRWLVRLVYAVAAIVGLVWSYDFGRVIGGGAFVGLVVALNGALFCSIVAGALAEKLCQWWPANRQGRPSAG